MTTISPNFFVACTTRGALKLHKAGIIANRHIRLKDWLGTATQYTGRKYTPKQVDLAITHLTDWIEQEQERVASILQGEA